MAANIQIARQQAKIATELWQNSEMQRAELEQKLGTVLFAPSSTLPPPSDQTTQTATTLEREVEHKKHIQALDDARAEFNHEVDKITAETEARVQSMNTTYEVVATQIWLELKQAKQDNLALQTLHDEREDRINMLVMKQHQKLNRKIDETLDTGWKKWSAQAAGLQVLRVDAKNLQKEGKVFF